MKFKVGDKVKTRYFMGSAHPTGTEYVVGIISEPLNSGWIIKIKRDYCTDFPLAAYTWAVPGEAVELYDDSVRGRVSRELLGNV